MKYTHLHTSVEYATTLLLSGLLNGGNIVASVPANLLQSPSSHIEFADLPFTLITLPILYASPTPFLTVTLELSGVAFL